MKSDEIVGAVGFSVMSIRPGDSALAMGLGDLPIAATSHFLNLMESAALTVINDYLEPGETTRLISMELEVFDAVSIGSEIRAAARCTQVLGKEIFIDCDIYNGERHVATAKMKRATVERVSFLARTAAQSIVEQLPQN
ncbi:unannotated protein [freshwater metagenome]|jgi:predicted thioesterase|uniref:Unannotated protein n=1 Tax=freshwater metagenome TaxID=449393 RepID=A0A6J6QKR0_9ZZZZ|nr:hypothetical protein [Actinomycetota bacterium]MSW57836.1 hypothetical protein [Actinomycetota bacterium]MSX47829.1 hypothetical protein [Actinomycetota bacterium]MSX61906.1 hypothetical protein [Actinomycetota bacterium]MSY10384.1 hypothetical protein [Actinomycetota bacterium]